MRSPPSSDPRLLAPLVVLLGACNPVPLDPIVTASAGTGSSTDTDAGSSTPTGSGSLDSLGTDTGSSTPTGSASSSGGPQPDLPGEDTGEDLLTCVVAGTCNQLDILLVVDNSGSMGEEQQNLAAQFAKLVDRLRTLKDAQGQPVGADVNIMVTTTDVGHLLCTPYYKPGYVPSNGAPVATPCTERLERFEGVGADAPTVPEACTANCIEGGIAAPADPFIHFDLATHNIVGADGVGDPAADALACIAPQGIDGCGMEAPLEAMLRALDPKAAWNQGAKPFLREGGVLAIVLLTDETDCSTENFAYFDPKNKADPEFNKYWEDLPGIPGVKGSPTSAACWNASMTCVDDDDDGVHESCVAADKEPLFPRSRYTDLLAGGFEAAGKPVFMLVLAGVPPVTAHDPEPPHGPVAGGVASLVHRDWQQSDILPNDSDTPANKQYDFGIGPGCSNATTGQATPPGRIRDVCEALNLADDPATPGDQAELRCCIESICDASFGGAVDCLADMLAQRLTAD
ncbi:MAG: VWA domain-containing protein [Nannocystis sp.]|nr:hypothetical protein [Nannocystis sp.]MBA3548130.1 VWA domain-containing protein [Nannocystis sp.]